MNDNKKRKTKLLKQYQKGNTNMEKINKYVLIVSVGVEEIEPLRFTLTKEELENWAKSNEFIIELNPNHPAAGSAGVASKVIEDGSIYGLADGYTFEYPINAEAKRNGSKQ